MLKAAFLLFLMLLFTIIGAAVVVSSVGMLRQAYSARNWPTVQGEILASQVVTELASTRGESGGSTREPREVYSAEVQYEYVVNGKTYRGQKISLQQAPSTDRHQAELTAKRYDEGKTTVYYNPDHPQEALLAPQDVGGIIPGIVIGLLLMIVPTGLIMVELKYAFIERSESRRNLFVCNAHLRLTW